MPVRTTITSGDQAIPSLSALVPMLILCCSGGTVGKVYTFEPGQSVSDSLGGGTGADCTYAALRGIGSTVRCVVAEPTWTAPGAVTHVGTGPAVTVALAEGAAGCFDDLSIKLAVTTGGAGGEGAAFSVAYDGSTVVETVPVPAEGPAVLTGTVDITYGAVLATKTLVFTAPAAKTITFPVGTLPASAAGLKAATATVAAPVTITSADLLDAGIALVNAANGAPLTFTTAGVTPANAPANIALEGNDETGAFVSETLVLSQIAGAVTSVHRYRIDASFRGVYPAADGVAATIAIGYADTYGTAQSIADAFNVEAASAPLDMLARVASTATAQYLELYSTGVGTGVAATIDDATSTADDELGFTSAADNLTADGSAATWSPPWTGLTFTFPASSAYVVGDTYALPTTGPRASLQAIANAAQAAHDDYANNPFGFLAVMQPAPDAPTCAATQAALASLTNGTWTPDPYAPVFATSVVGSQFHTASPVLATNNAAIAVADAALTAAFAAQSANLDSVAVDDVYITGSTSLLSGSFRRTAAVTWAVKAANKPKIAADVADGVMPDGLGASLLGPDGLTRARNVVTQANHLEDNRGFSCLRSTSAGLGVIKFSPGYTRAGSTSRLRFEGVVAISLVAATLAFAVVERWEGLTAQADPLTGQLSDNARKTFQQQVYTALQPTLLPTGGTPNCSDFTVEILNPSVGRTVDNGEIRVKVSIFVLAEIITVYLNISDSGVITTIAA